MTPYSYTFAPDAAEEYLDVVAYYDARKMELGDRFSHEVADLISRICDNPLQYPVERGDVRKALADVFPFILFCKILNNQVVIYAVYHGARVPGGWRARLS